MLECLVDGEICDRIPVADRGLHYGDGLFVTTDGGVNWAIGPQGEPETKPFRTIEVWR